MQIRVSFTRPKSWSGSGPGQDLLAIDLGHDGRMPSMLLIGSWTLCMPRWVSAGGVAAIEAAGTVLQTRFRMTLLHDARPLCNEDVGLIVRFTKKRMPIDPGFMLAW